MKARTVCVRNGHRHEINVPGDPSAEVPCPDCGSRLAADLDAYRVEEPAYADISRYALEPHEPTTDAYPYRCADCSRPIERYSRFPGDRCIACHERVAVPVETAEQLAAMWRN